MMQHYLAISFGKDKEYGIVFPYESTDLIDLGFRRSIMDRNSIMDRKIVGNIQILYDGNNKNEAELEINGKKTLNDLVDAI